jgi:Ca2+-binding EF-hand superfamily protein
MRAFKKSNKTVEEIFKNSIKEVDRDNDGKINFEEFKELMLRVK